MYCSREASQIVTKNDFINELAVILDVSSNDLVESKPLQELENWDSVAYLSTIVLLDDRLGLAVSPDALQSALTVGDLVVLAQSRLAA